MYRYRLGPIEKCGNTDIWWPSKFTIILMFLALALWNGVIEPVNCVMSDKTQHWFMMEILSLSLRETKIEQK